MNKIISLFVFFSLFVQHHALAQKNPVDSTKPAKPAPYKPGFSAIFKAKDTSKPYSPRIATLRSAVLPGWGQITNKKYWKLPIVYGALGITVGVFFHNVRQYREARDAYTNATDGDPTNNYLVPEPYFSVIGNPDRILTFRGQVRQNVDYSVLFFIAFWGLNVADAAVDAHLKMFDVSDDLSLNIKAGHSQLAGTDGISLVLSIGNSNKH